MAEKLVVDCSVALKWFLVEPYSDKARQILLDAQTGVFSFLAPDFIHAEIANIAWQKHLKKGMAVTFAQSIVDEFQKIDFTFVSERELLNDAYSIAIKYGSTVYDSLYVALSVREACRFVTADEPLYNAVSADMPNVVLLANWS